MTSDAILTGLAISETVARLGGTDQLETPTSCSSTTMTATKPQHNKRSSWLS